MSTVNSLSGSQKCGSYSCKDICSKIGAAILLITALAYTIIGILGMTQVIPGISLTKAAIHIAGGGFSLICIAGIMIYRARFS